MRKELAEGYWARACEALDTMEAALERGNNNNVVTMAYHAMEHAAKAMLAAKDIDAESHRGVLIMVSQELVKTGKADQEISSTLRRVWRNRSKATYSARHKVDGETARTTSEQAREYLKKARGLMIEWGLGEKELERVRGTVAIKATQAGGDPGVKGPAERPKITSPKPGDPNRGPTPKR